MDIIPSGFRIVLYFLLCPLGFDRVLISPLATGRMNGDGCWLKGSRRSGVLIHDPATGLEIETLIYFFSRGDTASILDPSLTHANIREPWKKVDQYLRAIDKLGQYLRAIDKLGHYLRAIDNLGQYLKAIDKLGQNLRAIDKLGHYLRAIDKLGQYLRPIDKLGQNLRAVDKLRQYLTAIDKLGQNLTAIDKLGQYLRAIDKLGQNLRPIDESEQYLRAIDKLGYYCYYQLNVMKLLKAIVLYIDQIGDWCQTDFHMAMQWGVVPDRLSSGTQIGDWVPDRLSSGTAEIGDWCQTDFHLTRR
ncbi:hypothetical protein Btru_075315 [Bulinus truncatus]|nr:hypothetical protein Btru_075315 [Bulinus truncatus]